MGGAARSHTARATLSRFCSQVLHRDATPPL
jgi:hypothetical protein